MRSHNISNHYYINYVQTDDISLSGRLINDNLSSRNILTNFIKLTNKYGARIR